MARTVKAVTAYRFVEWIAKEPMFENRIVEFFHLDGTKTREELNDLEYWNMGIEFDSSSDPIDLTF